MSLKRTKRILAALTLFFFFTSSFSYSAPPEYLNDLQEPFGSFLENLPRELGAVKSLNFSGFFDGSGARPFVIHIQDAHANPEAQLRIKEILTWLHQTSKLSFHIGMEGAVGPIHPEYLEFFSDFPEANEAFVRDLHQKGELTGAEWFAWEQYKDGKQSVVPVSGVETAELYRENLKNFRDLLFRRDEISAALEPFRTVLEIAKTNQLSPGLRTFVREKEKSREVFISYLTRSAKKVLDIDLKSSIEQLRFPNLTRLIYVQEIEPRLDEKAAKAEWAKIKTELARYPETNKWIDALDAYWREPAAEQSSQTAADSSRLRSIFEALFQGPGFSEKFSFKPYPHYSDWARHVMLSADVEAPALFSEIDRVSQAIENRLAITETDKKILILQADFTLFEKLNLLELTREEFSKLKERKNHFAPFEMAKRFKELSTAGKPGFSFPRNNPLLAIFDETIRFYETAEKRDAALLENALGLVSQNSQWPSFVVLITGGFHTDGLTRLMTRRSISHAVIAPALTRAEEGNPYHRVLRRENADLSAYFKNPPLNKQEALFFKGLIEKAMPELAKKKLASTEIVQRAHEVLNRHPLFKNLEASFFPGEEEPFVRLTVRKGPIPASSQAVAEVANTSNRDLYPYLAAESLPLSFTATPIDLLPSKGRFNVRRVETLAARAENRLTVESGPITPDALAQLGLAQVRKIAERGALGVLAETPQLVENWAGARLEVHNVPPLVSRQEVRIPSVKELIQIAGLTPDVMNVPSQRKKHIENYNLRAGGLSDLLANRTDDITQFSTLLVPKSATPQEKLEYLQHLASGERVFIIFAGGFMSRMDLPSDFAQLGIGGLTSRILRRLEQKADPDNLKTELIRAIEANVEDLDDLSLIQRVLIELRFEIETLASEVGFDVKTVLEGISFAVVTNPSNKNAIARHLRSIKFAGLHPFNVYLFEQGVQGGEEILPDGTTRWYEETKWPEDHGDALTAMVERTSGAYRFQLGDELTEIKESFISEILKRGVRRAFVGKINDLHLLEDMTFVERWLVSRKAAEIQNAEMVVEVVDNRLRQPAGVVFKRAGSNFVIVRDSLAVTSPELSKYQIPAVSSRMWYDINLTALEKLKAKPLSPYLSERRTRDGKTVLTRVLKSGDASSVLNTVAVRRPGYQLKTIKNRTRISAALTGMDEQDEKPAFKPMVARLIPTVRLESRKKKEDAQIRERLPALFSEISFRDLIRKFEYGLRTIRAKPIPSDPHSNRQEVSFILHPNSSHLTRFAVFRNILASSVKKPERKIYLPQPSALRVNLGGRFTEIASVPPFNQAVIDQIFELARQKAQDISIFKLIGHEVELKPDGSVVLKIKEARELLNLRLFLRDAFIEAVMKAGVQAKGSPLDEAEIESLKNQFRISRTSITPSGEAVITLGRIIPAQDGGTHLSVNDLNAIEEALARINEDLEDHPVYIQATEVILVQPKREFLEELGEAPQKSFKLKQPKAVDPYAKPVKTLFRTTVEAIKMGDPFNFRQEFQKLEPEQRDGVLSALEIRLKRLEADWKESLQSPKWRTLWWRSRIHAILWLIHDSFHHSEASMQFENEAIRLLTKARQAYFVETGKIHPLQTDADGGIVIPENDESLRQSVLAAFGSGVRIQTRFTVPPNMGYEGSVILAAAIVRALLVLRQHPSERRVTVTAPLRWQVSSAGGSDNFDWALRYGMTMIGGPFYLNGVAPAQVTAERLNNEQFEFESVDLDKTSKTLSLPSFNDPLRYLKAGLVLVASLRGDQPSDDPLIQSFLASVLEGLPGINVYGGVNSMNALAGGGIRFTGNDAGHYEPESEVITDSRILPDLQRFFRLFDPGIRKGETGKVSTTGRMRSRASLLLTNNQDTLHNMHDLHAETLEMKGLISSIGSMLLSLRDADPRSMNGINNHLMQDIDMLAISVNNIQDWTNKALQEDVPAPLGGFIEDVRTAYEDQTKRPLGILVQGAGPVGGILFVGSRLEFLDRILERLLPVYEEEIKRKISSTSSLPRKRPGLLPMQFTTEGIQVHIGEETETRSELRTSEFSTILQSYIPTSQLKEKLSSKVHTFESLNPRLLQTVDRSILMEIETAGTLAAEFYDPETFDKAPQETVFHILKLLLDSAQTQDPILRRALEIAREALGEYAWLLDQEGKNPIHMVEPSSLAPIQNPAGLFLALAGPRDQATLIAGEDVEILRERVRRKWPYLSSKVKIVGTDGTAADSKNTLRAMRKLVSRGLEQELGTFHSDRSFLENLNVQGFDRFLLARPLDQDTVFLITAFLLRHQIADRDIVNLQEWMNEKGIDENDLVHHVAEMIKAVSLFLTQA